MPTLTDHFTEFCRLVETGSTLEAIERFYDDDVAVFENRELARSGKEQCLAFERELLASQTSPASIRITRRAVDEAAQVAFIEYVIRFQSLSGRPMRLEEVAVQTWSGAVITSERFYYAGFIDEGD